MQKFTVGDYVKWEQDGSFLFGRIKAIGKATARVSVDEEWEERVPLSALTYLPLIRLDKDEYRTAVRLESDPLALLSDNVVENVINADGYALTVEDLLAALQRITREEIDEDAILAWIDLLAPLLTYCKEEDADEIYTETDAIRSMHTNIFHPWKGFLSDGMPDAIAIGRMFLEDRDKPLSERRYPLYVKERMLQRFESNSVMNAASEEHLSVYRSFAEELAEKNHPCGLNAVGYGCYGGDRAFACDWERSRDCISRLFEIEDGMPKKAFLANTLGYIYYYGRCNGGIPEYETAYKYFSFAAFNGVYEARYKIADMFEHGYGVVRSVETARSMIGELYRENLKYLRRGIFDCKLADVALRMGGLCANRGEDEENDYNDYEEALYYYTQAEFAIRMRMLETNYYGDGRVRDAIAAALAATKEKLSYKPVKELPFFSLFPLLCDELTDGRRLDLVIKKKSATDYKLTFTPHKRHGETRSEKMLLTVPALGMCGLFSKLTLTYKTAEELPAHLLDRVLTVDEISYRDLLFDGIPVLPSGGYFQLRVGKHVNGKAHRFVAVSFGHAKEYDYLCDDESIGVGDRVTVKAGKEECTATVCRVFEKTESETSFPIKAYKSVLRKA